MEAMGNSKSNRHYELNIGLNNASRIKHDSG
jgi:hypothetical protein